MKFRMKLLKNKVRPFYKIFIFYSYYFKYIIFTTNKNQKKQIIMIFDGKVKRGGLVDRLKGIISAYDIATKLNADFKIHFISPFELDIFLEPNQYNWIANVKDLSWNPFQTKIIEINNDFAINPMELVKKTNKKKIFIFANVDYLQTLNPSLNEIAANQLWKKYFDELFIKSPLLSAAINNLNIKLDSIAVHTRFTNLLGDFNDSNTKEVSDEQKLTIISELKQMISAINIENKDKSIYVFSDSINFLNEIKATTNYYVLDGNPVHVDSNKNYLDKNDIHLKTFLDFFAIANCEKVYFLINSTMYNSVFSKYAAIIGEKKYFYRYLT